MNKKRVLIIAYYWPPSGGGGVQRWVKFVKYLKDFGWEPIVYVPENANYPIYDESLIKDIPDGITIVKHKIWEPYAYYSKILGENKNEKVSVGLMSSKKAKKSKLKELMFWIRGNLFIPDARKFWIKPSIKFLSKYIKENNLEYIVSTGPPHSMHLIALALKKKLNIKWLADFRDPWVHMDNYIKDMKYTKQTLNKHIRLEKEVLKTADKVVTVTNQIVEDYTKIREKSVELITNGFDTDDFSEKKVFGDKFIIGHYGTLGQYRNPETFIKVLSDICKENNEFKNKLSLELIGPVDVSIFRTVEENGLSNNLLRQNYLSHKECISKMINASILLLLLDKNATMKGRMTGKIFEYLAAKNAILAQGSLDSDPVKVLNETKAGKMFEYTDYKGIKSFILEQFSLYLKQENYIEDVSKINKYSRRELTKKLAFELDKL